MLQLILRNYQKSTISCPVEDLVSVGFCVITENVIAVLG